MYLWDALWTSATYVVSLLTLSSVNGPLVNQQAPLLAPSHLNDLHIEYQDGIHQEARRGPIFKPPGGRLRGPGSDFKCDYSNMVGWSVCTTPDDRGCWLKRGDSTDPKDRFDINTNYETRAPKGVTRYYRLVLTDDIINTDGIPSRDAKIFNGVYPGPWIQACWGDQVVITVTNRLKHNGTSIHWHGIRQLNTTHMDGVNGITQCPIAPGDTFTYNWTALQYGSSWYHSHYSVQYADGALGPLTLHGPHSDKYDEAKIPILISDWGHNSAFESITVGLEAPSILLNGVGNATQYNNSNVNTTTIPERYTLKVDSPVGGKIKRYLLRLINTSFESTFIFSVDFHNFWVVEADFVPIKPYRATSVLIGIGQRYHVILEASDPVQGQHAYWIRTWRANCFNFPQNGSAHYETTGVLRYGDLPTPVNIPNSPWPINFNCSDESPSDLQPVISWPTIPAPANDPQGHIGENLTVQFRNSPNLFPLAKFSMGGDKFNPLQINFGDPIFLHLNYTGAWPPLWVVYPENYTEDSFVWMVIKGPKTGRNNAGGPNAHPIHLHGHDFAILQQNYVNEFPDGLDLNVNTPPRRDVVLLPDAGYVVIAFKTDNPGTWIVHCHIAFHAAFGLAIQILERQQAAANIWPSLSTSHALAAAQSTCNNWNKWWGDCTNWWPGEGAGCPLGAAGFSPDSGI